LNYNIPENTEAEDGASARFECVVFSNDDECSYHLNMLYYHSNGSVLYQSFSTPCVFHVRENRVLSDDGAYSLNVSVTFQQFEKNEYRYTFFVADVNKEHNNSVFSCSILSEDQIQWQKNATLVVVPRHAPETIASHYNIKIVLSVVVISTALAVGATLALVCVLVVVHRRTKQTPVEPDRGMYKYLFIVL